MSPSVQFMVCNDHYKQNTALFLWNTYEKINPFLGLFFIFYNTWLSTMSPSVQFMVCMTMITTNKTLHLKSGCLQYVPGQVSPSLQHNTVHTFFMES